MNTNVYDTLYNNMKQRFTIVSGENEYTLGGYMRMKAQEKNAKQTLPTAVTSEQRPMVLQSVFSYIGTKLAVKEPPAPEKTIKAFPLRTTLSAICSALLICTLTFSFGAISGLLPAQGEGSGYVAMTSTEETETEKTDEQFVASSNKNNT